jgi:hypothetical protein
MPLDFDINPIMHTELDKQYSELEIVSERIKKLKSNLTGFNDIISVYSNLWEVLILPLKRLLPKSFIIIISVLLSCVVGLFLLLIGFPIVSGFLRLPWSETLILVLPLCAISFVNSLKRKLGVTV